MRRNLVIDPRIRCKPDELITPPVVIRVTKFNEEGAKSFGEELEKAHHTGQPVIPVVVDSFGGEVYSLLDMITQIQSSKLPVVTVLEGKGMSCGAMLFAMGNQRYMAPHSTMMLHDVSTFSYGKVEEVKSNTKEMERLQQLVFSLIAKNVGKDPDYFTKILHEKGHAEWYLTAKEAKKHGLATHIGIPELTAEVAVIYKFA
jgi:ATP-dependent Clp protease, protease subunit